MREDALDDLIRRALHSDPWSPDLRAAQQEFAHLLACEGDRPGDDLLRARLRKRARQAGVWLAPVAAVTAAVTAGLVVAGSALPGQDTRPADAAAVSDISRVATVTPHSPQPFPSLAPIEPTPGDAAPYTATQVCGAGFIVIDSAVLPRSVIYLLRKESTQENCVVTLKTSDLGTATPTSAFLQPHGAPGVRESGQYKYFATVTASTPGCISWGGSDGQKDYLSDLERCS